MTILEDMITAQRPFPALRSRAPDRTHGRAFQGGTWSRRLAWSVAVWLVAVSSVAAQQKPLTLDDIYDPDKRIRFSGSPSPAISWIDSTHYAWPRSGSQGVEWTKVDVQTGAETPLFDAGRMESAFAALPGIARDDARRAAHSRSLKFDAAHTAAVLEIDDDLYAYAFDSGRAARLTSASGSEEHPSFSPDAKYVAYVRANNLYVSNVTTGRETALTTDGTSKILNGRLDWVYEEEIYGRGENRAYWWSPDSTRIAFLRLDDTPIPSFAVVDHIPYEQDVEQWDYPKAGDPNPIVKLGVASVTGGTPLWVDASKYHAANHLIVRVGWTPDSQRVVYEAQNRTQSWIDLNTANVSTGKTDTLFRETSKFWIGADDAALPLWRKDGSFFWISDRSGWRHLYHYKSDGTLIQPVTAGKWELRELHGLDEAAGWIYFSGTERSHIGNDVYRIKTDGTGLSRLSKAEGTHAAEFSPAFAYYVDKWSDVTTPPQTRLHKSDGTEVRVIDENKVSALADYKLSKPELLQVKTRDGFVMEAMMIKPPDFDPSRRYPVYQFTYGGPHSQQVRNQWGGSQYMYHQLLAQKGIIVWICDNRTASGKGSESVWPLFKNLGEIELRDIEDGLSWLKAQAYVDPSRIGIHGWSYGGFVTSYALTHSQSFVMGIAGGTVSDWRNYDTIYTERYMGTPEENPDGYRKSAPRFAASDLHGALMLIHGLIDDNVHLSNTIQLVYELQKAQKPFQLMLYPKSRHGVTDPELVKHLRSTMLAFVLEQLKPDSSTKAPATK
jgi:dipeptidyl-peptidase 4